TDGLDDGLLTVAQGDAQAVAAGQAVALVGDQVGDLGRVQAAVDLAGEGFELGPDLLLPAHLPHALVAQVAGGQVGHDGQEVQVAAVRGRVAVGLLEHLDQAGHDLVDDDRHQHDHELGRV